MHLENVEDIYPLTSTQAGMLFHSISAPDSGVYIGQVSSRLTGTLNQQDFIQAWQQVVQRHACLRTAFVWDGVDEPLQVVRRQINIDWKLLNWQARPESDCASDIATLQQRDRSFSFDLAAAPLMRMTLIQLNDDAWQLLWTFHHLLLDGWSTQAVLNEVLQLYHAAAHGRLAVLPEVPPWRNYIAWLQARESSGDELFWRQYLSGFDSRNVLQTAASVLDDSAKSSILTSERSLPIEISALLVDTAKELRITLSTLIHGAWALLLHHYCGQRDLVFGSTMSGRPTELKGVENMIGMFINTLPVRVTINPQQTLREWLQALQSNLLSLRDYEATPLVNIQSWSDLPRGQSLFDSIVVFENYPAPDQQTDRDCLKIGDIQHLEHSHFPLALLIIPEQSIRLIIVHHLNGCSESTALQMLHHLQTLLSAIPAYLDQSPLLLPILDDAERQRLASWNDTDTELPSQQLIHEQISRQAGITPDAVAVVCGAENISYATLDSHANQWAHELIAQGVTAGDCVAICINRSVSMIVALLATLKAGAAYVPLDAAFPSNRLNRQLLDCAAKIVLSDRQSLILFAKNDIQIINIEDTNPQQPATTPVVAINSDSLAYVIYTSGSTGQAKGVQVSHKNLLYSTSARQQYPHQPTAFLLLSSLSFDSSVAGIFWSLCQGATLVVSGYRMEQDPQQLANLIAHCQISHTLCLPSLYQSLLEYTDSSQLSSLKTVIVAGEVFPTEGLLALHRQILPNAELYNEYGPTEATVWATVFNTRHHPLGQTVPIGKPIANTRILLLDSEERRCPIGLPGEIYIGGQGVATGYLKQNDATAKNFVTLPVDAAPLYRSGDLGRYLSDGSIVFLGRCDNQIKIRGYRIEPDEITATLSRISGVEKAIVVALPAANETQAALHLNEQDISRLAWQLQAMGLAEAENLLQDIESLPDTFNQATEPAGNG